MNFNTLAATESVTKTVNALNEHGFQAETAATGATALQRIKDLIPAGASVMNGSSTTLQQIGFVEHLKSGAHGWRNLHEAILAEKDPVAQALLRTQAVHADYFLASAHAITEEGEIIIANASGSSIPSLAYTSKNIILVVSTKKIVPDLSTGLSRVRGYVFPLEDRRMKETGASGSVMAKILILEREPAFMGRAVHVMFVSEDLGF